MHECDRPDSALAERCDMTSDDRLKALDAENRLRALDLGQSFIVQAPAGAGKTELLTQRYLGLLTTVSAPEQIVALTFTRKAASEMRNRILKRLEAAAGPEPASAHERQTWQLAGAAMQADRQHGWGILDNPGRLRIATIDALCASLVRQMPYLSRFGGMPAVAEKAAVHYEEAARRTLEAVEEFPAVAKALDYLDNDALMLRKLLVAMLAFRDQWLVHVRDLHIGDDAALRADLRADLSASLRRLVERDLAHAARLLAEVQSPALMAAARYLADFAPADASVLHLRDWSTPLCGRAEELERWRALVGLLLTKAGEPRKLFGKDLGFPSEKEAPNTDTLKTHKATLKAATELLRERPKAAAALRAIAQCPTPLYAATDLDAIETFVDVLIKAYGFLWGVFQEAGATDFIEVAERALDALGETDDPSELALKLDYALHHLLVDEFQDTNHHQIALLEKLTAGWTQQDGRTLFVVGDPMQSIYRFRKADVGLFLTAWQRGIGTIALNPLTLYRNNRSVPRIIDWINATFAQAFPTEADPERGMVPYSRAIFTRPDPSGLTSGCCVHPIIAITPADTPGNDAESDVDADMPAIEDGDEQEARTILDIVADTWRADPMRDIAILVRARSHLAPLVAEIRRRRPDLRYEAVEIESLAARQPIQDLLALTRALCHRGDRVNWLAILRAPWCGLTLADLYLLARPVTGGSDTAPSGPTWPTLWSLMQDASRQASLSADGRLRLLHVCTALHDTVEYPGRQSLRRQIEGAWRRLGGHLGLGAPADAADVAAYFRLLDKLDAAGRFDLDLLETDIQDLFAAPSTDPQAARLKFMTVHKAKGLEFDTVILPGLHRDTGRHEQKLLAWEGTHDEHGKKHLVVAPYSRPGTEADTAAAALAGNAAAIRAYIHALEKTRADQENRRVLYVAATRAIRSLHLLGVAKAKASKKTGEYGLSVRSGTPLHTLWPMLSGDYTLALREKLEHLAQTDATTPTPAAPGDIAGFAARLQRLPLEHLPQATTTAATNDAAAVLALSENIDLAESRLARRVGTLVHRYLELIASEGVAAWDAARVRTLRPLCEKWLHRQGHDRQERQQGAEHVEHALINAVSDPRGRWILQSHGEHDACELALTQQDQGVLRGNIVDRTFIEDDTRWIIDYKTERYVGADIEAHVAAKCREHAAQLARYAALFQAENRPVRKALYFVALNRFEILP